MNSMPSGARHSAATAADGPTMAMTWSSSPDAASVARKCGSVSSRPVAGSTSDVSWYSQPGWFSSEPWWWSTVITRCPAARAAAAR
jgi:hypothetical protein